MFSEPIEVNTPPNSPKKSPPRIKRKRIISRTNNNTIAKRIKFEDIQLDPSKNPIYFPKDKSCYIDNIPLEILALIFNYVIDFQELLTISKVCKRWRQVLNKFCSPSFISENFSVNIRKRISNSHIEAITRQFPNLKEISLYNCSNIYGQGFQSIIKNCKKIEKLKIDVVGYCPDTFINNISLLPSLKELKIVKNIELWGASNLPTFKLKKLEIIDNNKFFDNSVMILAQKCHQLESLTISKCYNFNLESQRIENNETSFDIENMKLFIKNNKNLRELYLSKININDKVLESIAACSNLEVLKIEHCFLITDEGINKIVGYLPNLKHITISDTDCTYVSFNMLINPIDFPNLEEIVFNNNNPHLLIHPELINFGEIIVSIIDARSSIEPKISSLWHIKDIIKGNKIKENIIENGKLFKLNTINLRDAFHPEVTHFKNIFNNTIIKNDLLSINFRVIP